MWLVFLSGCYSQVTTIPGAAQRLRPNANATPTPETPVLFPTNTPVRGPSPTPTNTLTPTRTPTATPTFTPTLAPTANSMRFNPNPALVAIAGEVPPAGLGVNPTMVRLEFLRNNVAHVTGRLTRIRFTGVPTHWIRFPDESNVLQPCVAPISAGFCERDIQANQNALTLYLIADAGGNRTLTATDITTGVNAIPATNEPVNPYPVLYSLRFKKSDGTIGNESFPHVQCSTRPIKLVATDFSGNPINVISTFSANLANLGSATAYSAAGCGGSATTTVNIGAGMSSADIYLKDATIETINFTAKGAATPVVASLAPQRVSFVEAVASVQITNGPSELVAGKLSGQTELFKIVTKNGNGVPFGGGSVVQLSSTSDPALFHNENGMLLNPAQFTMPDNGEVTFRVKVTPDPNDVKGQTKLIAKVMNTTIEGSATRTVLTRPIYSVISGPENQAATTCTPTNGTYYTLLLKNFLDQDAADPVNDTTLQITNLGSAKIYRENSNCGLSKGNGDVPDQPLAQLVIPKGVAQINFRVKDDKAEGVNLTVTGPYPLKDGAPYHIDFKRTAFALHPDFGPQGKGVVLTNVGNGTQDSAGGIALQNGSFTIAVSSNEAGTLTGGLARFTPWGLLDNTLQASGVLRQTTPPFGVSSELLDVAPFGTDKLFAIGRARPGANDDFVVARYSSSGALDQTFGTTNTGFFTTDFGGAADAAQHIEPLTIGTTPYIYTAGPSAIGGATPRGAVAFARYKENGTEPLTASLPAAGNMDFAGASVKVNALTPYKMGGVQYLLVAGAVTNVSGSKAFLMMVEAAEPNAFKLAASFDGPTGTGDGIILPSFGGVNESFAAVNVLENGDLVATGTSSGNLVVAVFNPDGTYESTIENGNGYFTINLGAVETATWAGLYRDPSQTVSRLFIAGSSKLNADPEKLLFVRVSMEGTLDSFAPNVITHNLVTNDPGASQSIRQCLIQPNGDLVCSVNVNGTVGAIKLLY